MCGASRTPPTRSHSTDQKSSRVEAAKFRGKRAKMLPSGQVRNFKSPYFTKTLPFNSTDIAILMLLSDYHIAFQFEREVGTERW